VSKTTGIELQTGKSSKKPKVTDELLVDGREDRTPTRSSHMITGGRESQLTVGVDGTVDVAPEEGGGAVKSRLRFKDFVSAMPCRFIRTGPGTLFCFRSCWC